MAPLERHVFAIALVAVFARATLDADSLESLPKTSTRLPEVEGHEVRLYAQR